MVTVQVGETYQATYLKKGMSGKGKYMLCQIKGMKNTTIFFDNDELPLCEGQSFVVTAINKVVMKGDKYHHDKTGEWRMALSVSINAKIGEAPKAYFEDVDMNEDANPFDDGGDMFKDEGELPF